MAASKQLEKARACVKKKNYEYAAELYILHLKASPEDVDARKELRTAERLGKKIKGGGWKEKILLKKLEAQAAMIRVSKKDPEKTILACEELLKQHPDVIQALIRLGEAASAADLNEVAVAAFEDAISVDKENKDAWRHLGREHERLKDYDKAIKCYQRVAKIDPKDPEGQDKVKRLAAKRTAETFEKGAKEGFRGLIDKKEAKKLEGEGRRIRTPEQALERISDLEPRLKEDPTDTKTMRLIAELYVKAEFPKKAIAMCERALKVDPGNYLVSELLGDLTLSRYEQEIEKLRKAFQQRKDKAIKVKYAQLCKEKRRFEIDEYRKRAEAHPTEPGHRYVLGKALYEDGRIDEAIPELQKAKSDPRKKSNAGYFLGQCFIKKKSFRMAKKELDAARQDLYEMDDLKKDITYLIGRLYEQAKQRDKAMGEYEQIAEVDYNYKDVHKRIEALD